MTTTRDALAAVLDALEGENSELGESLRVQYAEHLDRATDGPWSYVRSDELTALHRVALEARDAVEVAAAAGVHLGPLRAALNKTAYKLETR